MLKETNFEGLWTWPGNRLAVGAVRAVCENPGQTYHPLWIYGSSGTGKTMLLRAIADRMGGAGRKVVYIDCRELTTELIDALQKKAKDAFYGKFRSVDVLLVDHMEYLAGKNQTQMELGMLFAQADAAGHQVVLASESTPDDLETLRRSLERRCEWMLLTDLVEPERLERLELARWQARRMETRLPEQILERIAGGTRTPAQVVSMVNNLAARRAVQQADEGALRMALETLLPGELEAAV